MPCRSDYMEQTNSEARFQETAKLLVYVWENSNVIGNVPQKYKAEADSLYAKNVGQVEELCRILRELRANQPGSFERTVYNARDPMSRRLATWWEEHEAEDVKRELLYARDKQRRFRELSDNLSAEDKRILKEYLR